MSESIAVLAFGIRLDDPPREWFRLLLRDARTTVSAWQELQMTQWNTLLALEGQKWKYPYLKHQQTPKFDHIW